METHPIQLLAVNVQQLYIRPLVAPEAALEADQGGAAIFFGRSEYDAEEKLISVGVKLETPEEKEKDEPFEICVELSGIFEVDDESFPPEHIQHWAENNAPYILMPYLREHVFALTARCGFKPMVLPLTMLPTLRLESERENPA